MNKEQVVKLLNTYHPTDAQEAETKETILQFINEHEENFYSSQELAIGHVTVAPWIINESEDKTLLLYNEKLNKWFTLAECSEDNDKDIFEAAKQSAEVVTGFTNTMVPVLSIFDVDISMRPYMQDRDEHPHYELRFIVKMLDNKKPKKRKDAKQFKWISKTDELPPNQARRVIRMFEKWKNSYNMF